MLTTGSKTGFFFTGYWKLQISLHTAGAVVVGTVCPSSVSSEVHVDPVLPVCHPVRAIVVTTLLLLLLLIRPELTMNIIHHHHQLLTHWAKVNNDTAGDSEVILASSATLIAKGVNASSIFDDVITEIHTASVDETQTLPSFKPAPA